LRHPHPRLIDGASKRDQTRVASPDFSFAVMAAKAPDHPLATAANIALAAAIWTPDAAAAANPNQMIAALTMMIAMTLTSRSASRNR
jgi:hypothetical protein